MTTIAYRDGVLAADSRAYGGKWKASPGEKAKMRRIAAGRFAGCVGAISTNSVGGDQLLWDWIERGAPAPVSGDIRPDSFSVLILAPDGLHLAYENMTFSGPIRSEFYAVGSGEDFALGALAMGATAEEAVQIASRFDHHTGGEIVTMRLAPAPVFDATHIPEKARLDPAAMSGIRRALLGDTASEQATALSGGPA